MSHDLKFTTPDGKQITPINARQWATVIIKLKPLKARQDAVEQVPEHLRELVKTMLEIAWNHPSRNHNNG
jgi:hypothetical protein